MKQQIVLFIFLTFSYSAFAQFNPNNIVVAEVSGSDSNGELVKLVEVTTNGVKTGHEVFLKDSLTQIPAHYKVWYQDEKYAGWPANYGMWNWGNEILVGYATANYDASQASHPYEPGTQVNKFSRSLDGGQTWAEEEAYAVDSVAYDNSSEINFLHNDFALAFRLYDSIGGKRRSTVYFSYDKGSTWSKPKEIPVVFPWRSSSLILTRTDYIIDGVNSVTAFLTVGFSENGNNTRREVVCIRTTDGGITWNAVSRVGPVELDFIMPSSIRLGGDTLLSIVRRTTPPQMKSFKSVDNGSTWTELISPAKVDMNGHPPALLKLADGRLCLMYAVRFNNTLPTGNGMYVVYSSDNGQTWGSPIRLRGKDGADWDIGYPRAIQRPDGKVVLVYYYNHANSGNPYRYIASTIFNPSNHE